MKKLSSLEQFDQLVENQVMFYFYTTWCPDCWYAKTFISEVEEAFDEFTWIEVDRDQFAQLAMHLNINGIPSFLAYKGGEEIGRFVSKFRKTKVEVEEFCKSLL